MNERFAFALERLKPADWERFEKLCSAFLAPQWKALNTVASPSGDEGRDAELRSPDGEPTVLIQYSITDDWPRKISDTAKKITKTFQNATVLVYMSNQKIGARADDIKRNLRTKHDLILDVYDKNWFLERAELDPYRENAAEQLAREIVDPYLNSRELLDDKGQALSSVESRAALIYLGLQWEDDTREKGLTKLGFDALVKAALRDTNPELHMPRVEVQRRVRAFMPTHDNAQIDGLTDTTLNRLKRSAVNYYGKEDAFSLSTEERKRVTEALAKFQVQDEKFMSEIRHYVERLSSSTKQETIENKPDVRVRRTLEKFLLANGEKFAVAVVRGEFSSLGKENLRSIIIQDVNDHPIPKGKSSTVDLIQLVVENILARPSEAISHGLRLLADSYTLMAFLRETPDVQSAVVKMFAGGDIWLDTTIVLPLLTESLGIPETEKFVMMIRAARDVGLRLHITRGVLEEVERHINQSITYARTPTGTWIGRTPFLYTAFALSGRPVGAFAPWCETFRGDSRPEDDVAAYLLEIFEIDVVNLDDEIRAAETDLVYSAQRLWGRVHQVHRRDKVDPLILDRLIRHDVENMVGVIMRRRKESKPSTFGYTNWCLTLDRSAQEVFKETQGEVPDLAKSTPFLSADFLLNYLAFGPVRRLVSPNTEAALPVILDHVLLPDLPPELLAVAAKVRQENEGLAENLIRRRVRDQLDQARVRLGPIAMGGLDEVVHAAPRIA